MAMQKMSKHRAYKRSKAWALPAVGAAAAVFGQPLLAGSTAASVNTAAKSTPVTVAPLSAADQQQALATYATQALEFTQSSVVAAPATSTATFDQVAQEMETASRTTSRADESELTQVQASLPLLKRGRDLSDYQAQILMLQKKLGVMKQDASLQTSGAGNFGPRTQAVVKRFQRANNLLADGEVGDNTWKKVLSVRGVWSQPEEERASRDTNRAPVVVVPTGTRAKVELALEIATDIADTAKQDGVRYVWGGDGPNGFDCSGFVKYALNKAGYDLEQRTAASIYGVVQHISKANVRPGDLFFKRNSSGHIYHVGFVGEDGTWVEARSTAKGVGVFDPWDRGNVMYGRIMPR